MKEENVIAAKVKEFFLWLRSLVSKQPALQDFYENSITPDKPGEYEIFSEVCEIEDLGKRETIIRQQCRGDEDLYHKVRALLSLDDEDCDNYGKYKILKKIGKGGMGIVYLAEYTENFDLLDSSTSITRQVALKTISPEQKLDSKNLILFIREIKTLAKLKEHQNIAHFIDTGTSEKGKPFFVMDYIDGEPINVYCDKNKLPINERILFFRQILDAINHLHKTGILHCDIKPNNIIVDLNGIPKVIDFGIASRYGAFISDQNSHTTFLQQAFTLNYASPEQIRGDKNLKPATDIYSLGVVLYELLTGQLPVKFNEISSYDQLISISANKYPLHIRKAISEISIDEEKERIYLDRDCKKLAELKNNLTNELDEITQKAISKRTQKRYETVKEFDDQFEEFLNRESIWEQLKKILILIIKRFVRKARRIPVKWAVASVIAILLFLGILSQSNTVRTIPYLLDLNQNQLMKLSKNQKDNVNQEINDLQKTHIEPSLSEALYVHSEAVLAASDKDKLDKYNVWGLSNLLVSLFDSDFNLEEIKIEKINTIFDKKVISSGCWQEKENCQLAISGWVFRAKSRLGKSPSNEQLNFILKYQSPKGFWSTYPSEASEIFTNAHTYHTALVILGLAELLKKNLINQDYKEKVVSAINRAVLWLLKIRNEENGKIQWSDCPHQAKEFQTQSNGLDGVIIHTLHFVSKLNGIQPIENLNSELRKIDKIWLENFNYWEIPPLTVEKECKCIHARHRVETDNLFVTNEDDTKQTSIPWAIIASVDTYPNGTLWQKAVIQRWLNNLNFSEDYKGFYYGKAEYFIALSYLRNNLSE